MKYNRSRGIFKMKISKESMNEINTELKILHFSHRQSNGIDNYINTAIKEGIELKGININPFVVDGIERVYGYDNCGIETRDAVAKIRDILCLDEVLDTGMDITPIPDSGAKNIVPVNECDESYYLSNDNITGHPGTISALIGLQHTEPSHIMTRKGPKGTSLKYVDVSYMTTALNYAALMDWSFEVVETRTDEIEGKTHISVLGCLTLTTDKGSEIVKQQWGSQVLKVHMELGDALKAATSDAMKKCASMLGIAADIYGGWE